MRDNDRMRTLHDRATRGHALSAEEHAQLDAWYAAQDAAEASAIGRLGRCAMSPSLLDRLFAEIEHLSLADQLLLLEHLVRRIRSRATPGEIVTAEILAAMAADPEIQLALRQTADVGDAPIE